MKRYLQAMLHIWSNMVVGRSRTNRIGLTSLGFIALIETLYVYIVLKSTGKHFILWSGMGITLFAWVFAFPAVIYLIDSGRKRSR